MNLEQIKNIISGVTASHISEPAFGVGESAIIGIKKGQKYPLVFLEIPYSFQYDLTQAKRKTYTFQLVVLYNSNSNTDNILKDHLAISNAESMGEAITSKLKDEFKDNDIVITNASGASLREYGADNAAGVSYDITVQGGLNFCNNSYQNQFAS